MKFYRPAEGEGFFFSIFFFIFFFIFRLQRAIDLLCAMDGVPIYIHAYIGTYAAAVLSHTALSSRFVIYAMT